MRLWFVFIACCFIQMVFGGSEERKTHQSWPVRCGRIKLKPGALQETRKWFQTMEACKEDLLAILEGQGVLVEAVFLDRIGEDDYLIYFMKEESYEKSKAFQSNHPLSKEHQEYKRRCWEGKVELEKLFNMDTIYRELPTLSQSPPLLP